MTEDGQWIVRLSATAELDYQRIIRWTCQQFGELQARAYATTLSDAVVSLRNGPAVADARSRDDVGPGMMTLHVARQGHRGRHLVVYRVHEESLIVEVLRILHDAMDPLRHL